AGNTKDSGSMDMTYAQRHVIPVGDAEGHILMLTEAVGTHQNTGGTTFLEGFSVTIRELDDLRQGNGPQEGYVIFTNGSDGQVVRFEGMVATVLAEDGTPRTSMKGEWAIIKGSGRYEGIKGDGTYAGYFTAEDKFHVDWEGWHSLSEVFVSAR
ncbi:MAG: hypothetical protein V3T74_06970, partial [Gemmatimonadales bacterium]